MGNGKAAVGRAFRDNALGPQVHREICPIIFGIAKRVPSCLELLLPRLELWDETPERRKVDDDAVVKIGIPKRGDALYFFQERTQLIHKTLLRGEFPALSSASVVTYFIDNRLEATFFVSKFRCDKIILHLIESVFGQSMNVEPH